MHIGFCLPQVGPHAQGEMVSDIARRAEGAGFHSLWVLDRLLFPVNPQEPYPASSDGRLPDSYQTVLDPIVTLTHAAAVTKRIRIGSSILVMPLYSPVLLARMTATLDAFSEGRLTLGMGLGWSSDEFDAVGSDISNRSTFADEFIDVLRMMWTQNKVSFDGECFQVPESIVELSPVQRPHPPLLLAAYTERGLARVATRSNGWLAGGIPLEVTAGMFKSAQQMAEKVGRSADELQLVVRANLDIHGSAIDGERPEFSGSLKQIHEDIEYAARIGVDELIVDVQFSRSLGQSADFVEHLEDVAELLRAHLDSIAPTNG